MVWEKPSHHGEQTRHTSPASMGGSTPRRQVTVQREKLYKAIFEASPDGVVVVDERGMIQEINAAAENLFGYVRGELLGQRVEVLVPRSARGGHLGHRRSFMDDPHARPMGIGMELRGEHKDGTQVPVEISLSPLPMGGERLVIATIRDMSQRNRLRDFGAGALRASEEERQRIARELHDDTAQHLATLMIHLRLIERAGSEAAWRERLEQFREELGSLADGVRRIARGLRPPELEDAGVVTAIRSHLRNTAQTTDVEVDFDADNIDPHLTPDSKLVLYRVVQEAVSNVVRHADATRITVKLQRNGRAILVSVEDDGKGFQPGRVESTGPGGLGLIGMQERAVMIGGRVRIESRPGEGTRVELEIPTETHEVKSD